MAGSRASEASCIGDTTLAAFAEGQVDSADHHRLEEHLADCHECRAVLTRAGELPLSTAASAPAAGDEPHSRDLPSGTQVGRYIVRNLIGRGAMGAVYVPAGAGRVGKCAIAGCNITPTIVGDYVSSPGGLAVDDASFYWTEQGADGDAATGRVVIHPK